jgi:cytochrome c oxidase assembly protein subunit 15
MEQCMTSPQGFKRLAFFTLVFAWCVVVLGAYVRLSDAGLGCPDWPGCYGQISPHHASEEIAAAVAVKPGGSVSSPKAWKEMVHRYFAGTLGILILALCIQAWRLRKHVPTSPWLPTFLVGLVVFQALLGMWTVTWLLKPVVVTSHLLGGLATLGLLAWLALGQIKLIAPARPGNLRLWASLGLLVVIMQIMLGGWTSTNYAALACTDLPLCNGAWMPPMDFANGFHLVRELGMTADGRYLSLEALTAIHWAHRLGAVFTVLYLAWLVTQVIREKTLARLGFTILTLLVLQFCLGVSNIWFSLPLPVAVLHNAVAGLLLISMIMLNSRLFRAA